MSRCEWQESAAIDLYFYEELAARDRARAAAHLPSCPECRERLQELDAIRRALAARPAVASPPTGDWSGFMRRLDEARAARPQPRRSSVWSWRAVAASAAMLAIVTLGVLLASRARPTAVRNAPPVSVAVAAGPEQPRTPSDRALADLTEQHLERSKLVVLGLAARDPQQTSVDDWRYERQLAGSLLSDTRLYRLAAQDRGLDRLARVMGDLETVLLETSLSDHADARALERVQSLIRKRDLVMQMRVVESKGI